MNSQVIREISPEGSSGPWRVGFMEKKGFKVRIKSAGVMEGERGDAETDKLT